MMRLVSIILISGLCWCATGFAQNEVTVSAESGTEYRAGLELFNAKNYNEALPHFKSAYELDTRNINALFAQGLTQSRLNQYTDAAATLRQVLAAAPSHEKSLKLLPTVLEAAGDTDAAHAAYDAGIEAMPDDSYFYLAKGVAYLKDKNYRTAIPLLTQAAERDPSNVDVKVRLMLAYREQGDMKNAHETARTILALNENHAQARVILADYLREQELYDEALAAYRIAARDIETKAYAEHYIQVIEQTLEEIEIEREYEARMQSTQ